MSDQTLNARPLNAFISPMADPAVVHLDGADAVVLRSTGRSDVSVWIAGTVTSLPADTSAELVTDLTRKGAVLRQALASLNDLRQEAAQALWSSRGHQMSILDDIRSYAIEAHLAGDICRDGLNDFLVSFDLSEYNPRVRVAYTLGGNFAVAAATEQNLLTNATNALSPSFAEVDDVDDETTTHEITLLLVTPTRLEDGRSGFTVSYTIVGTYVVDHDDVDQAAADCTGYLRPDLDDIEGLVTGTDRFTVEDVTADHTD